MGALTAEDVLVLGTAVVLPWFWGGVGLNTYRAAAAVVAIAAGWALIRGGAAGLSLWRGVSWLLPAALLGAWAFVQTVPLPRAWVAAVSPKAASLQAEAFGPEGSSAGVWMRGIEADARTRVPEAASAAVPAHGGTDPGTGVPSPPRGFTLSLQPSVTLEKAFWYAALLLAFLLVQRRTADDRRAAAYRATLFVSFGVLAIVGILNHVTAPNRLLWLRDAPFLTHPFGPYVDPSHFGGVMELAVPWLLGYGLQAWLRRGAGEHGRVKGVLALVAAGLCAAAALLAASRMAAMTLGVVTLTMGVVAIATARERGRRVLLVGALASVFLLGSVAFFGPLRGRVEDLWSPGAGGLSGNVRGIAWTSGFRLGQDYALTGSGFGAFGELYPAYLPRGESDFWDRLHNDYLELYVAGGLVAVALASWLTAGFVARAVRVVRAAAVSGRLLSSLGRALGLAALAAHEAVEFNLQIPANALLFVVISAMAVAPLVRTSEGS